MVWRTECDAVARLVAELLDERRQVVGFQVVGSVAADAVLDPLALVVGAG